MQNATLFGKHFAYFQGAQFSISSKELNTKKISSDGLFLLNSPYFASNHGTSLSKYRQLSKNFFKTPFFAVEKNQQNRFFGLENRLKPTIWRPKKRLK